MNDHAPPATQHSRLLAALLVRRNLVPPALTIQHKLRGRSDRDLPSA